LATTEFQPPGRPVQIGQDADWLSVGVTAYNTAAVKRDGSLWAWGLMFGHLPRQIAGNHHWLAAHGGAGQYFCATRSDHALWCWGSLTGFDVIEPQQPVVLGDGLDWSSFGLGFAHQCVIDTAGRLWCGGRDREEQLGDGPQDPDADPATLFSEDLRRVGAYSDWNQVGAAGSETCGIRSPGTLWCWGDAWGPVPVQVGEDADWLELASGVTNHCARKRDGSLWCWGDNESGQLGFAQLGTFHEPLPLAVQADWAIIDPGFTFTCGRTHAGDILCWGSNFHGELGAGDIGGGDNLMGTWVQRYSD
jgi:alpha-tubulin suppressor-like RCC1 family protein